VPSRSEGRWSTDSMRTWRDAGRWSDCDSGHAAISGRTLWYHTVCLRAAYV